jgi:polyphosphate kinase
MSELEKIEKLLPDHLYAGSKDWRNGNVVERVEWLLSMYESQKEECDYLYEQLNACDGD